MRLTTGVQTPRSPGLIARRSLPARPSRSTLPTRPLAVASPQRKQPEATPPPAALDLPSQASLPPSTASKPNDIVFVDDSTGERIPVMPADYGFRSGAGRLYESLGAVPTSVWGLAAENFRKELLALRRSVRFDEFAGIADAKKAAGAGPLTRVGLAAGGVIRKGFAELDEWLEGKEILRVLRAPRNARDPGLHPEEAEILERVRRLSLDDAKVAAREKRRETSGDIVEAPWFIYAAYTSLCWLVDVPYAGRPIQRFWFLETVARMPYFAFISMLHLYESLGWWRAGAEIRKVHFAQEWNELHHLQIMEALGGDQLWVDRFLAEHAAVFYYWVLVLMYLISPSSSYAFSELVERHATDTYAEFAEQNEKLLRTIPPPLVALNYYKAGDLYLFDQMLTGWAAASPRRPPCNTLYDVFVNIRDDEVEHIKTMAACKDGTIGEQLVVGERERSGAAGGPVRRLRGYDATSSVE